MLVMAPPRKRDALASELEDFDTQNSLDDLKDTISEILALFPSQDKEMFEELLKFVPYERLYDFFKFVDRIGMKDSPMLQMMLLQFFAPFKMKLSALDIAKSSGVMYEEIMTKYSNEFFGDVQSKFNDFLDRFNVEVDKKILELNNALNSHSSDIKAFQKYVGDAKTACDSEITKIRQEGKNAIVEINKIRADTIRDKEKVVSEISKEVVKEVLHTVNSWTSWLGALFIMALFFISGGLLLYFAKTFHLFN